MPFGTGRFDFYGGDRPGNNLFANSLVALDARTGKRLWHFQIVHHDVWDYDLPTAPRLLTIRRNGRTQDVVAQPTKQGFVFVFDRVTGEPVWPIEERPVPQSDVPGERTSPTQPFPTRPAPFARQSFTEKDINPYLPAEEREAIRARLRSYRNEGLFTPPSFQGTVQIPGHGGGANWGSSAVDPARGELYVLTKNLPTMLRVQPRGGARRARHATGPARDRVARGSRAPEGAGARGPSKGPRPLHVAVQLQFTNTYHMTPIGPPWSEIVAYDLNTGDIKWRVPHGTVAAPAVGRDSRRRRRALAARRTAGHGRWSAVRGDELGPHLPRLRSRQRQGGVEDGTAGRVGGRAGHLRDRRPSVHRGARGGRARLESRALPPRYRRRPRAQYVAFALPAKP